MCLRVPVCQNKQERAEVGVKKLSGEMGLLGVLGAAFFHSLKIFYGVTLYNVLKVRWLPAEITAMTVRNNEQWWAQNHFRC